MPAHKLLFLCAAALAVGGGAEFLKTGDDLVAKVPGDVSWSWMADLSPNNNTVMSGSEFELKWAKWSGPVAYTSWQLVSWTDGPVDLSIAPEIEGVPYPVGTATPDDVSDIRVNGAVVGKAGSQQGSVKRTLVCPESAGCKVKFQVILYAVSNPDSNGIGPVDASQYNVSPVLEVTVEVNNPPAVPLPRWPAPVAPPAGPVAPTESDPSSVPPPAPVLKYVAGSWREHFYPGETITLGAEKWHGAPYPATWKILMAMGPKPADNGDNHTAAIVAGKGDEKKAKEQVAWEEKEKVEDEKVKIDAVVFLDDAVIVPVPSDVVCDGTFSDSDRVMGHMLASCQTELPLQEGIFYYQAFFCVPKVGGGELCSNSPVANFLVSVESSQNQQPTLP